MTAGALGELRNMDAGNSEAKSTTLASRCMLSMPTVISGGYFMSPAAIRIPARRSTMKVM
jgi:hypothetical protein